MKLTTRSRVLCCALIAVTSLVAAACAPAPGATPPEIRGATEVGSTLTTTNGAWEFEPTSYTYQWWSCATADHTDCREASSGAETHTLAAEDVGRWINVTVTAYNGAGSNLAHSAYVGPVTDGSTDPGAPGWDPEELSLTLVAGSFRTERLRFTGELSESDPLTAVLDGSIADVATVDDAQIVTDVADSAEVPLTIEMPGAATGAYDGTLRLHQNGVAVTPELDLTVDVLVTDALTVPPGIVEPSRDQVVELASGDVVVANQIIVAVDFDHADPEAVVRAAAAAIGATIIGSDPALRIYQLRTPPGDPETLRSLAEQVPRGAGRRRSAAEPRRGRPHHPGAERLRVGRMGVPVGQQLGDGAHRCARRVGCADR